jgi:organic radical activating enzyme
MPEPRTLEISEIFWSAQGEGSRCGISSIFIRLAGCRVCCPYCDTRHAWSGGRTMAPGEISSEISKLEKRFPASQIVFTGGEPLEQNMTETVACLRQKNFFIAVETSGLYFQDLPIDWWSVSPKDVTGFRIHPKLVPKMDEVKLIVNRNLTLDVVKKIRRRAVEIPIFLQPQFFHRDKFRQTFRLYEESQRAGIRNIRLGFQLHTMFGIR